MSTGAFPPASFDGVMACYTMIHLPREEHPRLLRTIAIWLQPGGLLIAATSAATPPGPIDDDWLGAPVHFSQHDDGTLGPLSRPPGRSSARPRKKRPITTVNQRRSPASSPKSHPPAARSHRYPSRRSFSYADRQWQRACDDRHRPAPGPDIGPGLIRFRLRDERSRAGSGRGGKGARGPVRFR